MSYNPHRTVKRNSSKEFLRFAWREHLPWCNQDPRELDLATVQLDQPVTLVQHYKALGGGWGTGSKSIDLAPPVPTTNTFLNG